MVYLFRIIIFVLRKNMWEPATYRFNLPGQEELSRKEGEDILSTATLGVDTGCYQ
jgi:hypothetical protein